MSTCGCGCGTVTSVTRAQETCTCDCDCCDTTALDRDEEIAGLQRLRDAADRRLAELEAS